MAGILEGPFASSSQERITPRHEAYLTGGEYYEPATITEAYNMFLRGLRTADVKRFHADWAMISERAVKAATSLEDFSSLYHDGKLAMKVSDRLEETMVPRWTELFEQTLRNTNDLEGLRKLSRFKPPGSWVSGLSEMCNVKLGKVENAERERRFRKDVT